jgi:hypothetical protein
MALAAVLMPLMMACSSAWVTGVPSLLAAATAAWMAARLSAVTAVPPAMSLSWVALGAVLLPL